MQPMIDGITAIDDLPVDDLINNLDIVKRVQGQRKRKGEKDLIDVVTAFDIETTTIWKYRMKEVNGKRLIVRAPHSFMYIWQYQLGETYTIIGRTWEEFTALQTKLRIIQNGLKRRLKLTANPLFVTYVHNLAYEWQFLQGVYEFANDDCFFRDPRKPIYVRLNGLIEFRCSYLHSNKSLHHFAEDMQCEHHKQSGAEFDYSKGRFPWTELSDKELLYCVEDVRVLEEAIRREMTHDGDTLKTIPLTSTGYVRRDMKEAIKPLWYSFTKIKPNLETYKLLRRCFRGGNTHANRFRVGKIVGPVYNFDIASDYPDKLMNELYPMGTFKKIEQTDDYVEMLRRIVRQIKIGKAVIADYIFIGLKLKDHKDPIPYLSVDKCELLEPYTDNGRVLSARVAKTALTEIDLQIVMDHYDFSAIKIYNAQVAIKAPLPQALKDVVIKYYEMKTALKDVDGKEYDYQKSKNKLNSTYGVFVQDPLHDKIYYSSNHGTDQYKLIQLTGDDAEKELEKATFPYQIGVYVTAYARLHLQEAIDLVPTHTDGYSAIMYCDTDSIKALAFPDLEKLNSKRTALSRKSKAYADTNTGKRKYMGVFERERDYDAFITQGAKRYAYSQNGELHVVVSGVSKKECEILLPDGRIEHLKGRTIAAEELRTLNRFKPGMKWKKAGGTMSVYNDADDYIYHDRLTGNVLHITPNVSIVNTTYTMSFPEDYDRLIADIAHADRIRKMRGEI